MTFLITDPTSAARVNDNGIVFEPVQRLVQEPEKLRLIRTTDDYAAFSTNSISQDPLRLFEGYTFLHASLLHCRNRNPSENQFDRIHQHNPYSPGAHALVYERETSLIVRPDISAQYPVFYHSSGGRFAISDNIHLIRSLFDLTPSVTNVVMQPTWHSSTTDTTQYDDVFLVPSRHFLRVVNRRITLVCYKSREDFHSLFGSYKEAMEVIADRLRKRCAAIMAATEDFGHRIVDVSGGVDSRMTLAGFLSTGQARRMQYFSLGTHPTNPDRNVSDHLIAEFGLVRGEFLQNGSRRTYTPAARLSAGSFRYMGLKNYNFSDIEDTEIEGYCRVTGYFGEFTKSFGSPLMRKVELPMDSLIAAQRAFKNLSPDITFLTDAGFDAATRTMADAFSGILMDVDKRMVNYHIYIENKGPFHFGVHSCVANKKRTAIDPLLDPMIMSAARFLTERQSRTNRVAFDLFRALGQDKLARYPLAGTRWSKAAFGKGHEEYYAATVPVLPDTPALGPELHATERFAFASSGELMTTEFDRDYVPGNPAGTMHPLDHILQYFKEVIPEADPIWQMVDRRKLQPLTAEQAKSPYTVSARDRLAATFYTYTEKSYADPISKSVNIDDLRRKVA